jgi:hypothetical protein
MLHSRQRRRSSPRNPNLSSFADPYSPDSPGYSARNKVFATEVADVPGLVRFDMGAPAPKQG